MVSSSGSLICGAGSAGFRHFHLVRFQQRYRILLDCIEGCEERLLLCLIEPGKQTPLAEGIEPLNVGEWTTLLIACKRAKGNHALRLEEIESRINNLIMNADEDGLRIKEVKFVLFDDLEDLYKAIKSYL